MAIGFKEIGRSLLLLAGEILRQFPPKGGRKEDIPILVPLALGDPQVAGLQIDIGQAELHKFRIAHPSIQQQFEHHHVRELAGMPHRGIEGDQFRISNRTYARILTRSRADTGSEEPFKMRYRLSRTHVRPRLRRSRSRMR